MRVRDLSANTQRTYLHQVGAFAKHFGRSPATLGPEKICAWQLQLVEVWQLARSSLVTATAALHFLCTVMPNRDRAVDDIVMSKKPCISDQHDCINLLPSAEVLQYVYATRSDTVRLKYCIVLQTFVCANLMQHGMGKFGHNRPFDAEIQSLKAAGWYLTWLSTIRFMTERFGPK